MMFFVFPCLIFMLFWSLLVIIISYFCELLSFLFYHTHRHSLSLSITLSLLEIWTWNQSDNDLIQYTATMYVVCAALWSKEMLCFNSLCTCIQLLMTVKKPWSDCALCCSRSKASQSDESDQTTPLSEHWLTHGGKENCLAQCTASLGYF